MKVLVLLAQDRRQLLSFEACLWNSRQISSIERKKCLNCRVWVFEHQRRLGRAGRTSCPSSLCQGWGKRLRQRWAPWVLPQGGGRSKLAEMRSEGLIKITLSDRKLKFYFWISWTCVLHALPITQDYFWSCISQGSTPHPNKHFKMHPVGCVWGGKWGVVQRYKLPVIR